MKFVHPNFLWALLFILIPLIIHLFHFRRYKKILFSNTQFLNEIKDEQATKNKLKHLLVLISRMLAVLFLVLAFAQPFIPTNSNSESGEKLIAVYLDNSFSMSTEGNGFLLFDEAKEMASRIIQGYSENNKFQVLSNDFEAKHQRIVSKSEALNLLADIKLSAASQSKETIQDKMTIGAKKFDGAKLFYQLSDFQKGNSLSEATENTQLNLVPFEPSQIRNLSIEEVWFESPIQLIGQSNELLVKIKNQSGEEQSGSMQLSLNGEAKSLGNYTIAANDFVIDTLRFTISQSDWNLGKVSLNDYPLIFDDDFYFSFYVEEKLNVYCIYEDNGEKFPKAVFSNNEQVNYNSNQVSKIDYNQINNQHLVVISNLKSISSGLSDALGDYIKAGGQVFFIPNHQGELLSYNQFFGSLGIAQFANYVKETRSVADLDLSHDLLHDLFDEEPKNISLPEVKEHYVWQNTTGLNAVCSFANGSSYLSSSSVENGQIYILASALGEDHSNFNQQAIFAPICFKMAILGAKNLSLAYTIEANTSISLRKLPSNSESIFRLATEGKEIIPQKSIYNGLLNLSVPGNELLGGFYDVYSNEEEYLAKVALNYSREESELLYYSMEELKENYANTSVQIIENNLAAINENVKQFEDGKSFWKLCVILALLFLAIEILLLRFLPN